MGARLPGSSGVYSYGIYLSCGLLPWIAFANSFSRSCSVFLDKKHLISKVKISLASLPLFISLTETITFAIACSLLLLFVGATGSGWNRYMLLLPVVYYGQQMLAYGLGLFAATITVFIKDTREIVGIILQLWFWFTPIVYTCSILPPWVMKIMAYNPGYIIINMYQQIFIYQNLPDGKDLAVLFILAHLAAYLAYKFFKKLEKDVRDFL